MNLPTTASAVAISPSYASGYRDLYGSGGVYGECGSYKCRKKKNGALPFPLIQFSAMLSVSKPERCTSPITCVDDDAAKLSSYMSKPRSMPVVERSEYEDTAAPVA